MKLSARIVVQQGCMVTCTGTVVCVCVLMEAIGYYCAAPHTQMPD